MRELNLDRIREMFWLFGFVLPIEGAQNKEAIKATFGHALEEFLPDLMIMLAQYCQRNPELFDMYLTFIQESILYMRNETDKHPEVEVPREEYEKFMMIQLGKYRLFKKGLEEKEKNG